MMQRRLSFGSFLSGLALLPLVLWGCGGDSDIRSIVDLQAPAVVKNVRALPADSRIRLLWTANREPDLVGYNIYRSDNSSGSFRLIGATGTSQAPFFQDEGPDTNGDGLPDGLINNTRFFYKITAFDRDGREAAIDLSPAVGAVPGSLPVGQADLEVVNVRGYGGSKSIIIAWDLNLSSLVFGYEVFRSQVGTNAGFQFAGIVPQGIASFSDVGLSNDTEYLYQVVPVTRDLLEGRRTQSRPLRVQDGDPTVPKPPGSDPGNGALIATQTSSGIKLTFGRPTQNTDGTLILQTGGVDDLVGGGFIIFRGKNAQGSYLPVGIIENIGNEISFNFTDGNGTAPDFYYVEAFDSSGNRSAASDIVSVASFVPNAPQGVDAFAGNTFGSVIVTWRLSAQAVDGYRVYRSEERDRGFREISGLLANTINTYTDTNLNVPGKTFYYKVASEANGILGNPSPPASATPGPDSGIFYLNAEDAAVVGISNAADFAQANGGGIIRQAFPSPFFGNGVLLIRPSATAVTGIAFVTLQWQQEIDATGFTPQQIFRNYDVFLVSARNSSSGIFDLALDAPVAGANALGPELTLTGKDFFTQNFGFPPAPTMERVGSVSFSDQGPGLPNPGVAETLQLGLRYQGFNPAIARGRGELLLDAVILVRR
ncbi:MAG: hypothetical protein HY816_15840 [Candidatus Wallbacteria bacterium]|nr:hypothetical protein [Candidatus Wallbacteria bacterium]